MKIPDVMTTWAFHHLGPATPEERAEYDLFTNKESAMHHEDVAQLNNAINELNKDLAQSDILNTQLRGEISNLKNKISSLEACLKHEQEWSKSLVRGEREMIIENRRLKSIVKTMAKGI